MNNLVPVLSEQHTTTTINPAPNRKPFIEANSMEVSLLHLQDECIIPVFSKDNEKTISHQEFISTTEEVVSNLFGGYNQPEVRVSHTIKGRTPEAIHKKVNELLDHEETVYYERMAFIIEIPLITEQVGGNQLTLTVGGVRCYNHENLYSKKSIEQFKVFIGFKNMVCCNMCVTTDGYMDELKAATVDELGSKITSLFSSYIPELHFAQLQTLTTHSLTESQFAQVLGKARLHNYLPKTSKSSIPSLEFTDTQIHTVAKDYFQDPNFKRGEDGMLNLWNMYNLLTGANKNSYIDQFLNRSVNAFDLVTGIGDALVNPYSPYKWFLK